MHSLTVAVLIAVVAGCSASILSPLLGPVDGPAVIVGPSGIVTRTGLGGLWGPGATIIAPSALASVVGAGAGLEGQWVPDNAEAAYDDGSYKPSPGEED